MLLRTACGYRRQALERALVLCSAPNPNRSRSSSSAPSPRPAHAPVPATRRPPPAEPRVLLLNKPYDVMCQFSDREQTGRRTLAELCALGDVYPAGRLDLDSEGLLVLTNDGRIQSRITEPGAKMRKVYWAQVEGLPTDAAIAALRAGVDLKDGRTAPAAVSVLSLPPPTPPQHPARDIGDPLQISPQGALPRQLELTAGPAAAGPRGAEAAASAARPAATTAGAGDVAIAVGQVVGPEMLWARDPPIRERRAIPTAWIEVAISEGRNRQARERFVRSRARALACLSARPPARSGSLITGAGPSA